VNQEDRPLPLFDVTSAGSRSQTVEVVGDLKKEPEEPRETKRLALALGLPDPTIG